MWRFPRILAVLLVVAPLAPLVAHDPVTTKVSWEREIAPLFQARCVSCHSPGGRGPMSLARYDEVRPWARAIREEVLARRMPKWHAVRGYGDFRNDPSLSAFEIALITAWVDGGAPRVVKSRAEASRSADPGASAMAGASPALTAPAAPLPIEATSAVLPCASGALPPGRLYAVTPALEPGGSLRLTLEYPDGTAEPLLWIRHFDPDFPQRYELRVPIGIGRGTRLRVDAPVAGGCQITLGIGQV